MIDKSVAAEILRLFHAEKWPPNTIATEFAVHHSVVSRVLEEDGVPRPFQSRHSKLEKYFPFIDQTLDRHPKLLASRLFRMCTERGYTGSESHFRREIRKRRPRKVAEAYLRLRMLPGEQAQVDWGHFGRLQIGRAQHRLIAFVMVLSYSRMIFLRFFLGDHTANFLRGHVAAFEFFGGCPRTLLYDNLKSAVLERQHDAIRFNPRILELAGHYRFQPRAAAVARGNEKGRVERAIRYVRDSFFAALKWHDLDDLNRKALAWCAEVAAMRGWPDDRLRTVREVFEQEESPRLLRLPGDDFVCDERREVAIGKTPYARFDGNDYSVPADCVRRSLTVLADLETVRLCDGPKVVAIHPRSFDRGAQIEDPAHIQDLKDRKHRARKHGAMDRLTRAVPSSQQLIAAVAERGENVGSAVHWMLRLLDSFGAHAVEEGTREAIEHGAPHPQAVRHIVDRAQRAAGRPPSIPVQLPDDPRIRDLSVKPHDLSSYDRILIEGEGGDVAGGGDVRS